MRKRGNSRLGRVLDVADTVETSGDQGGERDGEHKKMRALTMDGAKEARCTSTACAASGCAVGVGGSWARQGRNGEAQAAPIATS